MPRFRRGWASNEGRLPDNGLSSLEDKFLNKRGKDKLCVVMSE
jgi:hypothetical protein